MNKEQIQEAANDFIENLVVKDKESARIGFIAAMEMCLPQQLPVKGVEEIRAEFYDKHTDIYGCDNGAKPKIRSSPESVLNFFLPHLRQPLEHNSDAIEFLNFLAENRWQHDHLNPEYCIKKYSHQKQERKLVGKLYTEFQKSKGIEQVNKEEKDGWITNENPPKDEAFLAYLTGGQKDIVSWVDSENAFIDYYYKSDVTNNILAWQPLPSPPNNLNQK